MKWPTDILTKWIVQTSFQGIHSSVSFSSLKAMQFVAKHGLVEKKSLADHRQKGKKIVMIAFESLLHD